jgi:hypothetical protein
VVKTACFDRLLVAKKTVRNSQERFRGVCGNTVGPLGANSEGIPLKEKQSFLICLVQAVLPQLYCPEMVQRYDPITCEDRHVTTTKLTFSLLFRTRSVSHGVQRSPILEAVRKMGFWQFQGRTKNREKKTLFYYLLAGF